MSDLMELVNECTTIEAEQSDAQKHAEALFRAKELNDAGFGNAAGMILTKALMKSKLEQAAAHKFVCITPQKINTFLERKAAEFNRAYSTPKNIYGSVVSFDESILSSGLSRSVQRAGSIRWATPTRMEEEDFIPGAVCVDGSVYSWVETETSGYAGIPPAKIIDRLKEVKAMNIFDYFTVGSVARIKDPILMGRINGTSKRFFLGQWGDDVSLDDLI